MRAASSRQRAAGSGQRHVRRAFRLAGQVFFCLLLSACCLLPYVSAHAQKPTPAPTQTKSVLLKGGTLHTGDGTVIDDAAVGFRDGSIDHVGHSYGTTAKYDTVISTEGLHIYPGLILPDNTLGLHEIDLVNSTDDTEETGGMEPEVRALAAYNTDSRIIPTVRNNGVLIAQVAPRGGTIAGSSAVVRLDAWDNAEAPIRAVDGVHMSWPRAFERTGWWAEPGDTERSDGDERAKRIQKIEDFFRTAAAYAGIRAHAVADPRMESMRGLFDGSLTLYVEADGAQEIQEAVLFANGIGVKRIVIKGGYDAWRVADLLLDKKVDVILRRLHSLPLRDDDDTDLPFRLPVLLKSKGVRFCLGYAGDMERMGGRNLAFTAGTAAAYGLEREAALQAITLDAARVLGIDKRYGSLTVGKSATLFVSTGDALDMRTNDVTHAFIDGRRIVLDDHQKMLYRQYRDRYAKP